MLNALIDELVVHVHLEDELFYPAVRAVSPMVAVALAEHRQIDDHLAATLQTDPTGARFDDEMAALAASIEGHAGEEEREMFPQSHTLGDVALEALGAPDEGPPGTVATLQGRPGSTSPRNAILTRPDPVDCQEAGRTVTRLSTVWRRCHFRWHGTAPSTLIETP